MMENQINVTNNPTADSANTAKTAFSRKPRRMLFGFELHSWEQFMLTALGVAGLVAIAVFVTTAAVVILQRAENARLQIELEGLHSDNLKLEAKIQPRRIDENKQSEIAKSLEAFAGKTVRLESYALDAEAAILGRQIGAALDRAKLKPDTALMTRQSGGSIAFAVHITGQNADLVKALLQSLSKAGLATSPEDPNPPIGGVQTTIVMGGRPIRPTPVDASVFVGVKPIE